jgi:ribosome-associated protein
MNAEQLNKVVVTALEDLKAIEITQLAVSPLTSVMDYMVICTARSGRHVRALMDSVVEQSKQAGVQPLGVEGHASGEWGLVDLGDVVVHVMLAEVREFYALEKLWDPDANACKVK